MLINILTYFIHLINTLLRGFTLKKLLYAFIIASLFVPTCSFAQDDYTAGNNDYLRQLLIDTQNQFNSAKDELSRLQDDNFNLKNQLKQKENDLQSLKYYTRNIEAQNVDKSTEIEKLNSIIKEKTDSIASNTEIENNPNYKNIIAEHQKLLSQLDNKNKEIKSLQMALSQTSQNNDALKIQSLKLTNDLNFALKNNTDYQNAIEEHAKLSAKISEKNKEIQDLKAALNQTVQSNEELKTLSQQQISNLNSSLKTAQDRIATLNSELSTMDVNFQKTESNALTQKDSNIALLSSKISSLQQELVQTKMEKNNLLSLKENNDAFDTLRSDPQTAAYYYFAIAKNNESRKNYNLAIENYQKSIMCNPVYKGAYTELAILYVKQGQNQKAAELFEKYLTLTTNPQEKAVVRDFLTKLK